MINEINNIKVTFYSNVNDREQIEFDCSLGRKGGVHICTVKENQYYSGDKTINNFTEELENDVAKIMHDCIIKYIQSN